MTTIMLWLDCIMNNIICFSILMVLCVVIAYLAETSLDIDPRLSEIGIKPDTQGYQWWDRFKKNLLELFRSNK